MGIGQVEFSKSLAVRKYFHRTGGPSRAPNSMEVAMNKAAGAALPADHYMQAI